MFLGTVKDNSEDMTRKGRGRGRCSEAKKRLAALNPKILADSRSYVQIAKALGVSKSYVGRVKLAAALSHHKEVKP